VFPVATTEHTIVIPRLVFESDALGELQAVTSSVCERSQPVLIRDLTKRFRKLHKTEDQEYKTSRVLSCTSGFASRFYVHLAGQ
jgi:hypothetical protein